MTSSATVVVGGPAQLVALVPYRLGFQPGDSLVLVEVEAVRPDRPRPRLGVVLRTDLPPTDTDPDVEAVASRTVHAFLARTAPDAQVLVVGYDSGAARAGVLEPGARAAATLAAVPRMLAARGRAVLDVLLVTAERFRSLTCDLACCPIEGTSLRSADVDRAVAEAVGLGLRVAPDRDAALPPRTLVDAARRSAAEAARESAARPWTPERRRALLAEWDAELDRRAEGTTTLPDPGLCGRLLAGFADLAARDAVLLGGARGPTTDRARAALVTGPTDCGEDVEELIARALREESDGRRSALAAALAVDVARHASGAPAAGAWAVAAWSSWNSGDGLRAGAAAEEALRRDPAQRLAPLVLQLLLVGRPARGG